MRLGGLLLHDEEEEGGDSELKVGALFAKLKGRTTPSISGNHTSESSQLILFALAVLNILLILISIFIYLFNCQS